MDIERFCKRMMELMPQMFRGMARYENNYLSQGKITLPQYGVLVYLFKEGEKPMSGIAQIFGVSKPSATGMINRLITQGLVARRHDEKDRRIVWIKITSHGRKIVEEIRKQRQKTMMKVFSFLSASDRQKYLQLFEQIVNAVNVLASSTKKGL